MIHDAMMHWRGKNKKGENWILFFVFFFFSFVLCVCVCVEREKRINEEHGLFFCIKSDIDGAGEGEKLAKRKGYWSYQHLPSLLSRSLSLSPSPSVSEVCSCINLKHKFGSLIHHSLSGFLISRYEV